MSKYSNIFEAKRRPQDQSTPEQAPTATSKRSRQTGKRSDPDFEQVTAYIRRQTHQETKIALLQEGSGRQFSELVEELLSKWLSDKNAKSQKSE